MIRSFLKGGIFYKTPQLHEKASISKDSDIVNKWYVDTKVNNTQIDTKRYVDSRVASIPIVDASSFVNISGNQNINGTKYFNSSPTVPDPTSGTHAANKAYVDSKTSSGGYTQSFGSPGWTKLPNGLIIQWGRTPYLNKSTRGTVTFPITFPNSIFTAIVSRQSTLIGTGMNSWAIANLFRAEMDVTNGTGEEGYAYYIAIGH